MDESISQKQQKKYAKQTKSIIDLYESMPDEVKKEIKSIINEEAVEYTVPKSEDTEKLSESSLDDIWLTPENDHWDQFFKTKDDV